MLEKDYEGSVCEVKTLKNVFIAAGRIDRIDGTDLEISDPSGPMPLLPYKTPVKISVFNSSLGFRVLAGQVYISNEEYIQVMHTLDFLEYERRRFFRLDIEAPAVLLVRGEAPDGEEVPDGEATPPEEVPVRVKILSLCGAMFESGRRYHVGQALSLRMKLYKSQEEVFQLVIHRGREWEGVYTYGAEIVDLSRRAEQNLCAYLFEQQRLQIQRNKARGQN